MKDNAASWREFDRILDRIADRVESEDDVASLNEWLRTDEEAARRYLRYFALHASLAKHVATYSKGEPPSDDKMIGDRKFVGFKSSIATPLTEPFGSFFERGDLTLSSANGSGRRRKQQASRDIGAAPGRGALANLIFKITGSPWTFRAAAAMLLLSMAAGLIWSRFGQHQAAEPVALAFEEIDPSKSPASAKLDYVARIVRTSENLEWGTSSSKLDFLYRISPNDPIRIAAGLVQIEFYSGAVIILHGPAAFTPTGPESGRLDRGRLTGIVANGNFQLTTQVAEVIDLGTEFGVCVDGVTGTDVLVFNGEVQVVSHAVGTGEGETLKMTEGMAARIRPDGTAEYDFPAQADGFTCSLSRPRNFDGDDELSLVDVICGGNGFDNYLTGAVDPLTGKPDRGVWRKAYGAGRRTGDGRFHVTSMNPPIDGVFVPPSDGKAVQLDSLGNLVDLPPNCGMTAGPIWARRRGGLHTTDTVKDFWGTGTLQGVISRLQSTRYGLVAMHANVGLSIDLKAIRLQQHCDVASFEAVVTNLDNSDRWNPSHLDLSHNTADFRVFVDGKLRYSRLSFRRADGDAIVSVPLTPADQRLTLVSSEGEGEIVFDHVVLVDPVITLEKPANSRPAL